MASLVEFTYGQSTTVWFDFGTCCARGCFRTAFVGRCSYAYDTNVPCATSADLSAARTLNNDALAA
eukprot:2323199-Amphidinium_carterae.1